MIKKIVLPMLLGSTLAAATVASADVVFYSTQAKPLKEADSMRNDVLSDFQGKVQFLPQETGTFLGRVESEYKAKSISLGVLGALHGEFPPIQYALDPMDDVLDDLPGIKANQAMVELGKLGTDKQMYIPWMQATYIMAANKEALQYLPEGADINALTYGQLADWAAKMNEASGSPKLGFPAGEKGLMHRFLQGYLYPSHTHSVVTEFRSDKAKQMWTSFREMWKDVNPRSTAYSFMQEPLLTGEVWVAFDHTARLKDAFDQRPDDFVAFPAPAGDEGRGFMPVVAGLAIPQNTPDRQGAVELVKYLSRPETQIKTLRATGFYPIAEVELPDDLPSNVRIAGSAVSKQATAADALPSLLPVGLGDQGGLFNKIYVDTFQQIVLRNADIDSILDRQASALRRIIKKAAAPCWAPDAPSEGDCPVN